MTFTGRGGYTNRKQHTISKTNKEPKRKRAKNKAAESEKELISKRGAQKADHIDKLKKKAEVIHEKTEYKVNINKSTTSPRSPLVVSSILGLVLIRLVGRGWGIGRRRTVSVPLVVVSSINWRGTVGVPLVAVSSISRRGSVSVPLVTVSGLQVLVLIALVQAISETSLLHDLGASRGSHRELGRDVGLGSGREVGDCIGQRFLVNNGRGESALDGVGLEAYISPNLRLWKKVSLPCR